MCFKGVFLDKLCNDTIFLRIVTNSTILISFALNIIIYDSKSTIPFFLFSAICSITIVYTFPVLQNESTSFLLKDHFSDVTSVVFCCQLHYLFLLYFSLKIEKGSSYSLPLLDLMITIAFFLIVFLHRNEEVFGIGIILLIVPFIALIAANFFIKKDEKLVKSADRIR